MREMKKPVNNTVYTGYENLSNLINAWFEDQADVVLEPERRKGIVKNMPPLHLITGIALRIPKEKLFEWYAEELMFQEPLQWETVNKIWEERKANRI